MFFSLDFFFANLAQINLNLGKFKFTQAKCLGHLKHTHYFGTLLISQNNEYGVNSIIIEINDYNSNVPYTLVTFAHT
jgi:hypothetical protein